MNKIIKKYTIPTLSSFLLIGSFYPVTQTLAQNQEPILIEVKDTDIGTEAFEKLKEFGTGGHATLGTILGSGQNMATNPGVGLGIGSGGNGYRPTVIIAVWTDKPFDAATGLQTIKNHLKVPSNPVTTNGDCSIACNPPTPSQTAPDASTKTQTPTTQTTTPTSVSTTESKTESVVQTVSQPVVATTNTTTSKSEEVVIVTTQIESESESQFVSDPVVETIDADSITAERIGNYSITPIP